MGETSEPIDREIHRIIQRCLAGDRALHVADEADRLEPLYPAVRKRLICDKLIAAAFAEGLPLEMLDAEDSCRDPDKQQAA